MQRNLKLQQLRAVKKNDKFDFHLDSDLKSIEAYAIIFSYAFSLSQAKAKFTMICF